MISPQREARKERCEQVMAELVLVMQAPGTTQQDLLARGQSLGVVIEIVGGGPAASDVTADVYEDDELLGHLPDATKSCAAAAYRPGEP